MLVDREKMDHGWVSRDRERERFRFLQQLFSYLAETIVEKSVVK